MFFLWLYSFIYLLTCIHAFFCFHHTIQIETPLCGSWAIQGSVSKVFVASYLLRYFLIFLEDYLYPCRLPRQASCIMRNMLPFLKHAKMSIQDNVRNLHPKYWKYLQDKSLRSWSYLQTKITRNRKNRVKIYHYFIKLFHLQILARSMGCFELGA